MKLNELLFEVELEELGLALFEKMAPKTVEAPTEEKKGQNNTVAAWAKKLNMSYEELHAVWDKAVEKVSDKTNYFAIMGIFKKMVTSLDGVTKKELKDGGTAKFNYKVRTQQTVDQLLDDKPPPKSAKPAEVKKVKAQISGILAKMREVRERPNNTPTRKARNAKELAELKAKRKELQASIE